MKKVLVIDDSALVRGQVANTLRSAGFEIVEAADGVRGLELLDEEPISLVITDFSMPKMSGLELLAAIRNHPSHKDMAVIVLSTQGKVELVQRGWELGVKAWLKKPFKPATLLSAVNTLLDHAVAS